jgi:hypothetical protein
VRAPQDDGCGCGKISSCRAYPAKIRDPARMISLLTSNRPDKNSARSNGRINTDDFHNQKPVSLTMTALIPENNRP